MRAAWASKAFSRPAGALSGIVNGLDTASGIRRGCEPGGDLRPADARPRVEQARLEHRFGWCREPRILFTVVSRLTWQKGIDLRHLP